MEITVKVQDDKGEITEATLDPFWCAEWSRQMLIIQEAANTKGALASLADTVAAGLAVGLATLYAEHGKGILRRQMRMLKNAIGV